MIVLVIGLSILLVGILMLAFTRSAHNKQLTLISYLVLVAGIFVSVASCVVSVPTGHTGVVTTFGKVEEYTYEAGVHMKLPFSTVINMDNRTQKGMLSMPCFSSDIQEVAVDYTINYRIEKANAQTIYRTIGKDYYNTVVTPCVQEALKTVTAKYDAEDLIGSRAELGKTVQDKLSKSLKKYNIELVSTAIENMDFTDAFTKAVEDKQVAAQNKLKAQTEAEQKVIEAEAAAKAKLIEANAQAQANDAITKSLNESILNQQWIEKWDGQLPQVAGSDANVILDGLSKNTTGTGS